MDSRQNDGLGLTNGTAGANGSDTNEETESLDVCDEDDEEDDFNIRKPFIRKLLIRLTK